MIFIHSVVIISSSLVFDCLQECFHTYMQIQDQVSFLPTLWPLYFSFVTIAGRRIQTQLGQ